MKTDKDIILITVISFIIGLYILTYILNDKDMEALKEENKLLKVKIERLYSQIDSLQVVINEYKRVEINYTPYYMTITFILIFTLLIYKIWNSKN
jgi:hypothetical protein